MATTRKTKPIDSLSSWEIDARATDARSEKSRAKWAEALRARDRANCERFKQIPQETYSREEAAELLGITPASLGVSTSFTRAEMELLMADWHGDAAGARKRSRKVDAIRELYLNPRPSFTVAELARLFNVDEESMLLHRDIGTTMSREHALMIVREHFATAAEIEAALGDDFALAVPAGRSTQTLKLTVCTEKWIADRLGKEAAKHGRTIEEEVAGVLEDMALEAGSAWEHGTEPPPPFALPIGDVILSGGR
jgi:hypothetical protein